MKLIHFKDIDFLPAIKALFKELKVPMNYVADEPTTAKEILKDTYKDNTTFQLADDVYFVGMVDDAAFEGNNSLAVNQIKSDYDGVLVFGITLRQRANKLLPTRSQLAEISRAFNREFYYTPVVLVFKYKDDQADYIAFANTERLQYKQAWREGEKPGKVSLLRDINIAKPHRGHEDIIDQLRIPTTGTKAIDTFAKLYTYWQEVFSVSVLNKKFYQELSNWYFWAVKHVTFPNKPTIEMVVEKYGKADQPKLDDLIQEHNATNVIRLLTRLLFTWFIKEKKLIPEDLFDLDALQKDILNDISPYHEEGTMFAQANKESIYYKAILQNLFFASLNCPIEADGIDNRTRGFRSLETADGKFAFGKHFGIDYLMRYKDYFKDPDAFLALMNKSVPFLNGGLFECLDDKSNKLYIDGFSDGLAKGEQLIVPDYLFFGVEEHVDLSAEYGVSNKGSKEAAVKGLINILKSYKFTITENTPIEEDVALDPELLGKVFENLLASYNPETKTTARKQTGSFYTPREIVNYMVDESLITYLKNAVSEWSMDEKVLDDKLHQLTSFDPVNPFSENLPLTKRIVKALDECKILDPACGSGAFPMGILQKMVHILQKLDPDNAIWKEVQLNKAMAETEEAYGIEDKKERAEKLIEINNAFDDRVNDPDYARKLYLIENCVYGVDIQPIATQIAKLRFFISLVVDQKVVKTDPNFGIRPLPNLETKFVTANTLIGIEKDNSLFYTDEIKELEAALKKVRHKIFSLKSKDAKLRWRKKDEELRTSMAEILKQQGLPLSEAEKLASWDPYDQNKPSTFFDPEWMFDISNGFNVIIGNPPYIKENTDRSVFNGLRKSPYYQGKMDLWYFFASRSIDFLSKSPKGCLTFIATNNWVTNSGASKLRNKILTETSIKSFVDFSDFKIFESAGIQTMVFVLENEKNIESHDVSFSKILDSSIRFSELNSFLKKTEDLRFTHYVSRINSAEFRDSTISFSSKKLYKLLSKIDSARNFEILSSEINSGIDIPQDFLSKSNQESLGNNHQVGQGIFVLSQEEVDNLHLSEKEYDLLRPFYTTSELYRYGVNHNNLYWIIYTNSSFSDPDSLDRFPKLKSHLDQFQRIITSENKPYGLNRARNEKFFKGERIVVQRKCPLKPSFVYVNFDTYFNRTFLPIKTDRIDLKYLTSILNSSLSAFWLKHKGKMQGDNFQVDKDPILTIPIRNDSDFQQALANLVSIAINSNDSQLFESVIDGVIFNLYFADHMKKLEIDVLEYVERDIEKALQGRKFDNLSDVEKEEVIEQLNATWSHPDNEVRNRIKLFAVRSPEILKPILES
jgi:adenine-specific DNA-methyltransferase